MKLKVCIAALLIVACLSQAQDLAAGVFARMLTARVEKGIEYPLVTYSQALADVAKMYAVQMDMEQEVNHYLLTWDDKFKFFKLAVEWREEDWYRNGVQIRECLAFLPEHCDDRHYAYLTNRIAHCFDDSPSHARTVYHERAIVAGWGVIKGIDGHWVCLYVVTVKE